MEQLCSLSTMCQSSTADERDALIDMCAARFNTTRADILRMFVPTIINDRESQIMNFLGVDPIKWYIASLKNFTHSTPLATACNFTRRLHEETCVYSDDKCNDVDTAARRGHLACLHIYPFRMWHEDELSCDIHDGMDEENWSATYIALLAERFDCFYYSLVHENPTCLYERIEEYIIDKIFKSDNPTMWFNVYMKFKQIYPVHYRLGYFDGYFYEEKIDTYPGYQFARDAFRSIGYDDTAERWISAGTDISIWRDMVERKVPRPYPWDYVNYNVLSKRIDDDTPEQSMIRAYFRGLPEAIAQCI